MPAFLAEFIDSREGSGEGTHVCYRGKSGQILNFIRDSSRSSHTQRRRRSSSTKEVKCQLEIEQKWPPPPPPPRRKLSRRVNEADSPLV